MEFFLKKLRGCTEKIIPRSDFESSLDGWSDGMAVAALAVRMSLSSCGSLSLSLSLIFWL